MYIYIFLYYYYLFISFFLGGEDFLFQNSNNRTLFTYHQIVYIYILETNIGL